MGSFQEKKDRAFMISYLSLEEKQELVFKIRRLGGSITDLTSDHFSATHLIIPKVVVGVKVLAALAAGLWILPPTYVRDSFQRGRWLKEQHYEIGSEDYARDTWREDWPTDLDELNLEKCAQKCRENVFVKWKPNLSEYCFAMLIDKQSKDCEKKLNYKRVLLAGGADVLVFNPPVTVNDVSYMGIDFVIAENNEYKQLAPFKELEIPCVTINYIADLLCQRELQKIDTYKVNGTVVRSKSISSSSGKKVSVANENQPLSLSGASLNGSLEADQKHHQKKVPDSNNRNVSHTLSTNKMYLSAKKDLGPPLTMIPWQEHALTKNKNLSGSVSRKRSPSLKQFNPKRKKLATTEKNPITKYLTVFPDKNKNEEKSGDEPKNKCLKDDTDRMVSNSKMDLKLLDCELKENLNFPKRQECFKRKNEVEKGNNVRSKQKISNCNDSLNGVPSIITPSDSGGESKALRDFRENVRGDSIGITCDPFVDVTGDVAENSNVKKQLQISTVEGTSYDRGTEQENKLPSLSSDGSSQCGRTSSNCVQGLEENVADSVEIIKVSAVDVVHAQRIVLSEQFDKPWYRLNSCNYTICAAQPPEYCNKRHGEEVGICSEDYGYDTIFLQILEAGMIGSAFTFLHEQCQNTSYSSILTVQYALHYVMSILNKENAMESLDSLSRLTYCYPPCAFGMVPYYSALFFGSINAYRLEIREGIFWRCVKTFEEDLKTMLIRDRKEIQKNVSDDEDDDEEEVEEEDDDDEEDEDWGKEKKKKEKKKKNDEMEDEDDDDKLSPWAYTNGLFLKPHTLPLDERLEIKISVLSFIVDVMEADMVNGQIRHAKSLTKHFKSTEPPLIVTALWGNAGPKVGTVNDQCKMLMKLFFDLFKHSPMDKFTCCIARILCLMAEAVYFCEVNDQPMPYPRIGKNCSNLVETFADLVLRNLEIDIIEDLVNVMRPHWFMLHVVQSLFNKYCRIDFEMSLTSMTNFIKHYCALEKKRNVKTPIIKNTNSKIWQPEVVLRRCHGIWASKHFAKKVFKKDAKGETKLHIACRKNNINLVTQILSVDCVNVNAQDNMGWTPLHEAACHGSFECVQLLLDYCLPSGDRIVDPFAVNNDGVSPLMDAVEKNHLKVAELLLKYGGSDMLLQRRWDGKGVMDLIASEKMMTILEASSGSGLFNPLASITPAMKTAVDALLPTLIDLHIQVTKLCDIDTVLKNRNITEISEVSHADMPFSKSDVLNLKRDHEALIELCSFLQKTPVSDSKLLLSLRWIRLIGIVNNCK